MNATLHCWSYVDDNFDRLVTVRPCPVERPGAGSRAGVFARLHRAPADRSQALKPGLTAGLALHLSARLTAYLTLLATADWPRAGLRV